MIECEVGDTVLRNMGIPKRMPLKVTEITDTRIICGMWQFDRETGAEIDDELGWGPPPLRSGSKLEGVE